MQNDQSKVKSHIFNKFMESSSRYTKGFFKHVTCVAMLATIPTTMQAHSHKDDHSISNTSNYDIRSKQESTYYLLNGYVRDSEVIATFDDNVLRFTFDSIDKEVLKKHKITSYKTFERVMNRYNKNTIAKDRENFRRFIAMYMQKFFTLEEAQNLYDFARSPLGKKDSMVDKEINLKFIELVISFSEAFEVPKLPPFELSSNDLKEQKRKKSILELVDVKKERQSIDFALLDMESYLRNFGFLSSNDIRNLLHNLKTVIIEYSLHIKSESYSQEELDSLIEFYKSKAGQNITLAWLNTYGSDTFNAYQENYLNRVLGNVVNYFGLEDDLDN